MYYSLLLMQAITHPAQHCCTNYSLLLMQKSAVRRHSPAAPDTQEHELQA